MSKPFISRPHFPEGYLTDPKGFVDWRQVESQLIAAKNYWLCTVRPNGHPHVVPKWGVWVDGNLYFDGSPETRHARNIAENPHVSVHLESGDEAVIMDGLARAHPKPSRQLGVELARSYTAKYAAVGYAPKPDQWDNGGLFIVTPRVVLAWTKFTDDPTKFTF